MMRIDNKYFEEKGSWEKDKSLLTLEETTKCLWVIAKMGNQDGQTIRLLNDYIVRFFIQGEIEVINASEKTV